jgi:cytochrome P450
MVESTLSDTENALSDTEIRDNLSIFFLAGHET